MEHQQKQVPFNSGVSIHATSIPELTSAINLSLDKGVKRLFTPIFSDQYLQNTKEEYLAKAEKATKKNWMSLDFCFIESDLHFKKKEYFLVNPEINSCIWDENFPQELRQEFVTHIIGYSSFLNLKNYVLRLPFNGEEDAKHDQAILQAFANTFKNIKSEFLKSASKPLILIQVDGSENKESNVQKNNNIWKRYITIRKRFDQIFEKYNFAIGLHFQGELPSYNIINRWKSQKISLIVLNDSHNFKKVLTNYKNSFLEFLNLKTPILLHINKISKQQNKASFDSLVSNLKEVVLEGKQHDNLFKQEGGEFGTVIDGKLEVPQPYGDNIDSELYQFFENDEAKYRDYQTAVEKALEKFPSEQRVVIYYIGAGRGGILFSIFGAAKKKNNKIHVYGIEKNPYPVQTIKKRIKQQNWTDSFTLVESDIRDYQMPEKPDIFVSELIGGFGDNQLSPECLLWAEKNVHPDTICIPQSYTSYVCPVSFQALYRQLAKEDKHHYFTGYFSSFYAEFESQAAWQFRHPLKNGKEQLNKNSPALEFEMSDDIIINGIIGYFTCDLHDSVLVSILPERSTDSGMFGGIYGWHPLYFPFEQSVEMKKGEKITLKIFRRNDGGRVWYEWQYIKNGKQSIIHNKDGWKIVIRL